VKNTNSKQRTIIESSGPKKSSKKRERKKKEGLSLHDSFKPSTI